MRHVALIFLLIVPSFAMSEIIDKKNAKLSLFNSVNVRVHDDVENGCWTNINETKTYAADQLEMIGAKVDRNNDDLAVEYDGDATFAISVIGSRLPNNVCIGHIDIRLEQLTSGYADLYSVIFYSTFNMILVNSDNLNIQVLDAVKKAAKQWRN